VSRGEIPAAHKASTSGQVGRFVPFLSCGIVAL
jgi:hypothetical protein